MLLSFHCFLCALWCNRIQTRVNINIGLPNVISYIITQRCHTLIYLHLFTDCFVKIFLNRRNKYISVRTKMSEVKLSAFTYRLLHEDFSSIVRINTVADCAGSVRTVFVQTIEEKSSCNSL